MLGKLAVGEIVVGEVVTGEIVLGKLRWGNDLTPFLSATYLELAFQETVLLIPSYFSMLLPFFFYFSRVSPVFECLF